MSGYKSDDDAFRAIRDQLNKLEASAKPSIAKTDPIARERRRGHALFVLCIDKLLREGYSQHEIAEELFGCHVSTVNRAYHYGDTKGHQLHAWLLAAAMRHARIEAAREIVGWSEPPPPSRTGTDDA